MILARLCIDSFNLCVAVFFTILDLKQVEEDDDFLAVYFFLK